jgi:hypothetical protein
MKRKPLLAQLSNCHSNKGKNVNSVLPCLREMNRINTLRLYFNRYDLQQVQTGSGAHPASCAMGTGGPFPGGKARPGRDVDYSPPSSAEVENE